MSDYLDEYLVAAQEQGYRDFWDGIDIAPDYMPPKEKLHWQLGYNKAHMESVDGS